jgi:Domain of unknown function (DUF2017)
MGSVRRRSGRVRVSLEPAEISILTFLTNQVVELLDEQVTNRSTSETEQSIDELLDATLTPVEPPTDPVLRRLLPDAYREDDNAAEEFRRLTEADLRAGKRNGLSQITTDLSAGVPQRGGGIRLDLDDEAVAAWLPALTDIRLAVGTRLDVTEDMDDERMHLPVDSPRYAEIATYDWLSWLQEAMVRAVSGE